MSIKLQCHVAEYISGMDDIATLALFSEPEDREDGSSNNDGDVMVMPTDIIFCATCKYMYIEL